MSAFVVFHLKTAILIINTWLSFTKSVPLRILDACVAQECYETGYEITESMNKSFDACFDFYNYACGGWVSKTTMPDSEYAWDKWLSQTNKVQERLGFLLDYPYETMSYDFHHAKHLYNVCSRKGITVEQLVHQINGEFGGWSLFSVPLHQKSHTWTELMLKAMLKFNVHPLYKISVTLDFFNTSRYAIYIKPGDVVLPEAILHHPLTYMNEIAAYEQWIYNCSRHIFQDNRIHIHPRVLKHQITRMIEFELQLASLKANVDHYEVITIQELSLETNIDWLRILNTFTSRNNERSQLPPEMLVIINCRSYMKGLQQLFKKIKPQTIANFVVWSVVKELSLYGDNISQRFNSDINRAVFKVKTSLSRERHCLNFVTKYLGQALVPKYVQMYFNNSKIIVEAKRMMENIKKQFLNVLKNSQWLSETTREVAMNKIKRIKYLVGYPNWIAREENLTISPNRSESWKEVEGNFEELFSCSEGYMRDQFRKLTQYPVAAEWPENLFEVNAYYNILQNSVIIPFALLEAPFFNINRPSVFNYGSLGFLIAHEISHAIDNIGRNIDFNGNFKQWWSDYDIKMFKMKSHCFVKYYNSLGLNGLHTLSENIADNVGLSIAHEAMMELDENEAYVFTPYLENLNKRQLFFISYAHLWCELDTRINFLYFDEVHTPNDKRIEATRKINRRFAEVFHCPIFENSCNMW